MTVRFEIYAAGAATPERLWDLVGDLRRLPEWTDADAVELPDSGTVITRDGGRRLEWTVSTPSAQLIELTTTLPGGQLGIGARVLRDPLGSRIILAAAFDPASRGSRWRFLLLGGRMLRRRFDRWSARALALAAAPPRGSATGG